MILLLDTLIFIWAAADVSRLDRLTQAALASTENQVLVSAATAWEIAVKHALGRLKFPLARFDEFIASLGFDALPIRPIHAIAAGGLPRHHDDPFDRMLVAQAKIENLTLVSKDRMVAQYDVPLLDVAPDEQPHYSNFSLTGTVWLITLRSNTMG